jgi:hypothetical protein
MERKASEKMKKIIAVFIAILFLVTLTAASASAVDGRGWDHGRDDHGWNRWNHGHDWNHGWWWDHGHGWWRGNDHGWRWDHGRGW